MPFEFTPGRGWKGESKLLLSSRHKWVALVKIEIRKLEFEPNPSPVNWNIKSSLRLFCCKLKTKSGRKGTINPFIFIRGTPNVMKTKLSHWNFPIELGNFMLLNHLVTCLNYSINTSVQKVIDWWRVNGAENFNIHNFSLFCWSLKVNVRWGRKIIS